MAVLNALPTYRREGRPFLAIVYGIAGNKIGAIQLTDRFALVDVAEELAERVISSLQGRKIKGRTIRLRRDREG